MVYSKFDNRNLGNRCDGEVQILQLEFGGYVRMKWHFPD